MRKPDGHLYHVQDGEKLDGTAIAATYLFSLYLYPKRTINTTIVLTGKSSEQFNVTFSKMITLNNKDIFEIRELSRTTVQVNDNETLCLIKLEFIPQ